MASLTFLSTSCETCAANVEYWRTAACSSAFSETSARTIRKVRVSEVALDGPVSVFASRANARIDLLVTDVGLPGMNGRQIADAVQQVTGALGVAVVIEAKHMCMMMRGVEKQNSTMNTSVMLGAFRESSNTRQEFLQLIGRSK